MASDAAASAPIMAQRDGFDSFYSILGVRSSATEAEIKRAYRQRAIASHPDKGGDAETFKAVAEAYEVLSDADRRATYDRFGRDGLRNGGGGVRPRAWAAGTSPEEVFRQMFGDVADLAALFREMDAASARGNGMRWQQAQAPAQPRVVLQRTPPPRSVAALERLTAELQAELFADDVTPPAEAIAWRAAEVRAYFEHGGDASTWRPVRPWSSDLHLVGATAPEVRMSHWRNNEAISALTMIEAADDGILRDLARRLADDGAVALPLGLDDQLLTRARAEAAGALPAMQQVTMPSDGSGGVKARGDIALRLSQYQALLRDTAPPTSKAPPAPLLEGIREALKSIGSALTPLLADASLGPALQLTEHSDGFVTAVPTDHAVNAHYDAACTAPGAPYERKLSLCVYLGEAEASHTQQQPSPAAAAPEGSLPDGRELLYDDVSSTWRALPPAAGTLLISLSDRVLHKVLAVRGAARLSLTVYFLGGYIVSEAEAAPPPPQAPRPPSAPPPPQNAPRGMPPPQPPYRGQPAATVDSDDSDAEEGAMDELG